MKTPEYDELDMDGLAPEDAWMWLTEAEYSVCEDDDEAWYRVKRHVDQAQRKMALLAHLLVLAQMRIPEEVLPEYLDAEEMDLLSSMMGYDYE